MNGSARDLLNEVGILEWGKCSQDSLNLLKKLLEILESKGIGNVSAKLRYFGSSSAKTVSVLVSRTVSVAACDYEDIQANDMIADTPYIGEIYQSVIKLAESLAHSYYFLTVSFFYPDAKKNYRFISQ